VDLLAGLRRALRQYLVARGVASSVVDIRGYPVHCYELKGTGRGVPVVLVHGLGGNANGFNRTFFKLAERFSRVLAFDFPGNGFSPLPPGGPLPLRLHVDLLAGFCETVVREPALVVGNSLGGAMSIILAHGHPQLVRALALVSPAGAKVAEERLADTMAALRVKTNAEARRLLRRLFHRAPLPALLIASEIKKLYGTPAVKALIQELDEAGSGGLNAEFLEGLKIPILLIWGGREKLLAFEGIDFFRAHLPPHAQIQVVDGFGHIPQMERPRELASRLIEFADQAAL
jgi:pimeloyl-ACP methyl ester carboxylesterase